MKRKIIAVTAALAVVAGIGNIVIYGESTVKDASLYESVIAVLSDVLDKTEIPKTEETAEPEETIEPEKTIEPEGTAVPNETVNPEETAEPEKTAEPEETAEPRETAEPENTAEPEETAEPENTALPTETAKPEETTEPEETAKPEDTALPTETTKPSSSGGNGGGSVKEDITVYMTVEKLTIGEGFVLAPTAVTVKSDTTVAMLLDKVLGEDNYQCDGTVDEGMYISAVKDSETEPRIPQYIAQKLDGISKRRSNEWLSEFDYTRESGWKYSVNGKYPSTSASEKVISDGDVVRWQFTLYGYGADLDMNNNIYGVAQLKKLADKKRLITLVADLKEEFGDTKIKKYPAYIAALDALEKIDSTQAEVDAAYKQLSDTDFSDNSGAGGGSMKISTSVSFETKVNEDESETVTADISTSAESFSAELDRDTIKKLAEKTEQLNIRAADTVISVPQSVFARLREISAEKAELSLTRENDSVSVSITSDGEVLDISGKIYITIPFAAEGYEDCVLVTDNGKSVEYEYNAGVLKFTAELNHVYNMRISPVMQLSDVDASAEYAAALDELMRRGIIGGAGNNCFEPDAGFTTGMLALMLYRESGNNSDGIAWYVKPMEWATTNGFIKDGDSLVKVNGEILDTAMRRYLRDKATDYIAPNKEMTRAEGILAYSRYLNE